MARSNKTVAPVASILPAFDMLKAEGAKVQAIANVCTATDLADGALCFTLAVSAVQGAITGDELSAGLKEAGRDWTAATRKVRLSEFNQGARVAAIVGVDATLAGIEFAAQQARAVGGHAFRAALAWLREVKRPEGCKRSEAASAKESRAVIKAANESVVARLTEDKSAKQRAPHKSAATAATAQTEAAQEFGTDAATAKHAASVLCRLAGEVAQRKSPTLAKLSQLIRDAIEEANVQAKRA